MPDVWADGAGYESYVGRWSRSVARGFLRWLAVPPGSAWLDFGCGTGALSQTILAEGSPRRVIGCDRSPAYVAFAGQQTADTRAEFVVAELPDLPSIDEGFDAVVAGLVLNFLPTPAQGVAALATRARHGAAVAAYVWDYAEGMQLMRTFWDAAVSLDAAARELDEDDYWTPFLSGQGPAPGYVASLSPAQRVRLRDMIRESLPTSPDGSIPLSARAWAVRGIVA
jgi:SAM-dependent methyltransferase